LSRGVAQSG